jgi:hypothetical protein
MERIGIALIDHNQAPLTEVTEHGLEGFTR